MTSGLVAAAAERAARERARLRLRSGDPGHRGHRHPDPAPQSAPADAAGPDPGAGAPEPAPGAAADPPPAPDLPFDAPEALLDALKDVLARRLTGDYEIDEFGLDRELAHGIVLPVLRAMYSQWFRVDVRRPENVPDHGAALVVSNHSGTLPWDALMTMVAVDEATPSARLLRPLAADLVFRTPVVGDLARRAGATLATAADASRLLGDGELVGVWPEGFKGLGKLYRDRYRLQRFGRGGFVSAAIRAGAPIVPVSVVGAEEAHPMLADLEPIARLLGVPYFPVTPTWPWLGPLGLVPFPARWTIEFGQPIRTDGYPPGDADDPLVVMEVTDHVREVIQRTLYTLLGEREPGPGAP